MYVVGAGADRYARYQYTVIPIQAAPRQKKKSITLDAGNKTMYSSKMMHLT